MTLKFLKSLYDLLFKNDILLYWCYLKCSGKLTVLDLKLLMMLKLIEQVKELEVIKPYITNFVMVVFKKMIQTKYKYKWTLVLMLPINTSFR